MINGFVLCGGRSQRMGRDKSLLTINGENMADRMANKLLLAGCKEVFLVRKSGMTGNFTTQVIWDKFEDHHPLYGLYCAQNHQTAQHVLITPCDMPDLSIHTLQRLLAAPRPVIVKEQPLLGIFPSHWKDKTLVFARQGHSSFAYAKECHIIHCDPKEQKNVNYLSDLGGFYDDS